MIKIAVDAMGGDHAPAEQVKGSLMAVKEYKNIEIYLYGNKSEISKHYDGSNSRIKIVHTAAPVVDMGEKDPVSFLKRHKDTSMAMALSAAKNGECDVAISAGATQALIVAAHLFVRRMKGIKRTALAPMMPKAGGGYTLLLDAGANIDITPEGAVQQALCGSIYYSEVMKKKKPKIGVINIGSEPGKGREFDKELSKLLEEDSRFNYGGNVEGKEILTTDCDILISDGFTMNVVLKTTEGAVKGFKQVLSDNIGILKKIMLFTNFKKIRKSMDTESVGGAVILGLAAPVIKAHGDSEARAFFNGIRQAKETVEGNVIQKIADNL